MMKILGCSALPKDVNFDYFIINALVLTLLLDFGLPADIIGAALGGLGVEEVVGMEALVCVVAHAFVL